MNGSCQTRRMYGHDYAIPGTYEITMVVARRRPVLGEIIGTTRAGGNLPRLKPSPLGQAVLDNEIPKIHNCYPMVDIWQVCLMPDHLHLIVRIHAPLPRWQGHRRTKWWRETLQQPRCLRHQPQRSAPPSSSPTTTTTSLCTMARGHSFLRKRLRPLPLSQPPGRYCLQHWAYNEYGPGAEPGGVSCC